MSKALLPAQCTDKSQHPKFRNGWNSCISEMLRLRIGQGPTLTLELDKQTVAYLRQLNVMAKGRADQLSMCTRCDPVQREFMASLSNWLEGLVAQCNKGNDDAEIPV